MAESSCVNKNSIDFIFSSNRDVVSGKEIVYSYFTLLDRVLYTFNNTSLLLVSKKTLICLQLYNVLYLFKS